jgi:hypothetical protein
VDPYTNASTLQVIISQSHSWTLSRFACTQSTVNNLGAYADSGTTHTGDPQLSCRSAAAACTSSAFVTINQITYCTDFSPQVATSSGSLIKRLTLARSTNIVIGYSSSAWAAEIRLANGASAAIWSVMAKIDLTQGYPLNSSPGMSIRKLIDYSSLVSIWM